VFVDRAVRIAEVEIPKLDENQDRGPQQDEDTIMLDQDQDENASDKGKAAVVDTTPPGSPVRLIQGSPSLAIPSAVQMALDEMKNEMKEELRNEIDELRADMRANMNRSGEATHKKIDEMMQFLLKIASQLPKS
jgi:CRISPR/Cas system CMR subunit Cmr4 (Cas7 group RAMP superfamily)